MDRPLDCGKCKKKATIIYKEIKEGQVQVFEVCEGCPILEAKIYGQAEDFEGLHAEKAICCEKCHTCLEDVTRGKDLGCADCYNLFKEPLLKRLETADQIAPKSSIFSSNELHVGKNPLETTDVQLSTKLKEFNEQLNEALKFENYEQAAWLRDQINTLKEETSE